MRSTASAVFILALVPAALGAQAVSPTRVYDAFGIHAGSPAIVSVGVGRFLELSRTRGGGSARMVFAVVEPGVNAGRLSAGFATLDGTFGSGWTVRATALRAWRGTVGSYAGGDVSVMVFGLGPRVGVFRRFGSEGASSTRVTVDFGVGI